MQGQTGLCAHAGHWVRRPAQQTPELVVSDVLPPFHSLGGPEGQGRAIRWGHTAGPSLAALLPTAHPSLIH